MSSEREYVTYKQFVESLPARTSAASGDKAVVSNSTDGPGSETNATQAQKVLAGNIAPAFDATRTIDNAYKGGERVIHNGEMYLAKNPHYGTWIPSHFKATNETKHGTHIDAFSTGTLEVTYNSSSGTLSVTAPQNIIVPSFLFGEISIPANTTATLSIPSGYSLYGLIWDGAFKLLPSTQVDGSSVLLMAFAKSSTAFLVRFSVVDYLYNGVSSHAVETRHFFFSKGGLEVDLVNKTIKATENIVCVMNKGASTNYYITIPKNTSITYDVHGSVSHVLYYDVTNSQFVVVQSYLMFRQKGLLYVASINSNGAGKILHLNCDVAVKFVGSDSFNSVDTLDLAAAFTNGWIELDTSNHLVKVVRDLAIVTESGYKLILNGTSFSYTEPSSSLQCILYDISSNTLTVKGYNESGFKKGCLATFSKARGITQSSVPVLVDGTGTGIIPKGNYFGEPIRFGQTYTYYGIYTLTGITYHQSLAIHGDYAIAANYDNTGARIQVYKFSTNSVVATLELESNDSFIPHCNVICFGKNLHSENSVVPLLYVSKWDYQSDKACLVYDITESDGVYEAALVQTIVPDVSSGIIGEGDVDWVVDTDNDLIYALAYKLSGSSLQVAGNAEMVVAFALPSASSTEVTLSDNDVVENFTLPIMNASQDKVYKNGKIYVISGIGTSNPEFSRLYVIDLMAKKIASKVILPSTLSEPEGLTEKDGRLVFDVGSGSLQVLVFS